jgi:hypothetical protein
MNNIQKRFIMFIFGCLVVRVLLVLLAKNVSPTYLRLLGFLSLIPAIGFLIIYFGDLRKTGREVMGNDIWWNELRPVHAGMYLLFAIYAITKKDYAWKVLLLDVCIGLIAFLMYHCQSGNFSKLFI